MAEPGRPRAADLIQRFREGAPRPRELRTPLRPPAYGASLNNRESQLDERSRAAYDAADAAASVSAGLDGRSGDVLSRALAVIESSRKLFNDGVLRGGVAAAFPSAALLPTPNISALVPTSGARPHPSMSPHPYPVRSHEPNVAAVTGGGGATGAQSPLSASFDDLLDYLHAQQQHRTVTRTPPEPSHAPAQAHVGYLGHAALIPCLSPRRELMGGAGTEDELNGTHALPTHTHAQLLSPPRPSIGAGGASVPLWSWSDGGTAPSHADPVLVSAMARLSSPGMGLGMPSRALEGEGEGQREAFSQVDASRISFISEGEGMEVGAQPVAAFPSSHPPPPFLWGGEREGDSIAALYATADSIRLEDPEATVARLRRRLAALDDKALQVLAPYLNRSASVDKPEQGLTREWVTEAAHRTGRGAVTAPVPSPAPTHAYLITPPRPVSVQGQGVGGGRPLGGMEQADSPGPIPGPGLSHGPDADCSLQARPDPSLQAPAQGPKGHPSVANVATTPLLARLRAARALAEAR